MHHAEEKVKILLVDDKPENLFSLEAILEGEDREIFCASSGNEALKLVIKNEFAIILSDVQMPGMDGFEMVEILRSNPKHKHIPIIFVTAISKEEKYVYKGYNEGAVDYLFKPLDTTIVQAKTEIFISLYKQKLKLKKQTKELKLLNEQKNQFIGMAAHDLRNPLGVLQYFSKLFLDEAKDMLTPEFYHHMEIMHSSSNFMMNMVNELLDISKIESGTFTLTKQNVDPKQLINEAAGINKIFADRKNISIKTEILSDLPAMMLDYGKITQILNNLIGNAIKFSKNESNIILSAIADDKNLTIKVKDNGQGIPEKEIGKLFQPFQTTSIKAIGGEKSTGLGLTIAAKMVEAHEGQISVESQVGLGSTFTIKLPIITSIEVLAKPSNMIDLDDASSGYREILVCEDDLILQMLMKNVLQVFDVKVYFANNGKEGLELLKENPKIDLVFTDLNMPVMGGIEFISEVKKQNLEVDIVILTATITDEVIEQSKKTGSQICLEKPISRSALKEILQEKGKGQTTS
jgi:signal transduction histidine kinase